MALSVNWATRVITVPQADLTQVDSPTTLYELDTNAFRLELKALEASENGMAFPDAHSHTTSYTIAGTTYARAVAIINGYSVEFEDGQYSVRLAGSNNDIWDVQNGKLVRNQVQVIPQNSAGLITVTSGSGLSAAQDATLSNIETLTTTVEGLLASIEGTLDHQQAMRLLLSILVGKVSGAGTGTETFRDTTDAKDRVVVTVDGNGNRTAVVRDAT